MKDILIMGIESSCDETSVSIVKNGREVLSNCINSQIKIHEEYGGVVPEIASRCHTEVINGIMKESLKENANPRKWVCVEAEDVIVESIDNTVLLLMANNPQATAIKDAFMSLAEAK